jgi:hypothetical protein
VPRDGADMPCRARRIGPVGTVVRTLGGLGLIYTAGGAILFYGASMLVAAWMGQPGCETTVVSNLVLRRDDQVGCPTLFLIDDAEARVRRGDTTAAP